MKKLINYLIFKGNCLEAITFYESCLDGEITNKVTFENSPLATQIDEKYKDLIFDSEVTASGVIIKASDSFPENNIIIGTNFSMFITFDDQIEYEDVFSRLAENGKILMPISKSSEGNKFGMLKDKFEIQWMLIFEA